jgi:chemotaxis protein MotB
MARRKRQAEHANHERWLVSYADFITLLFAFFVVMFATSQVDKTKAKQVSDSVTKAFEGQKMTALFVSILGNANDKGANDKGANDKGKLTSTRGPAGSQKAAEEKTASKLAELLPSLQVLSEELKSEIAAGRIQISMEARGLVISFKQAALFPSSEDVISLEAYSSLEKIAAAIEKIPNPVRLEGHTDSRPINTPRFRSNWELSAARSIALMEILTTRYGVPKTRLSIAGYADTAPVATNDTEEGRALNRRADIIILNEQGVVAEPPKVEEAVPPPK